MHAAVNILQEQVPEGAHCKQTELSCRQPLPLRTLSPEIRLTSKQGYLLRGKSGAHFAFPNARARIAIRVGTPL